jgi:hypothetical protein
MNFPGAQIIPTAFEVDVAPDAYAVELAPSSGTIRLPPHPSDGKQIVVTTTFDVSVTFATTDGSSCPSGASALSVDVAVVLKYSGPDKRWSMSQWRPGT